MPNKGFWNDKWYSSLEVDKYGIYISKLGDLPTTEELHVVSNPLTKLSSNGALK